MPSPPPPIQVAAVLEYATQNAVEPFLEPVLELANTILQRDALEVGVGAGQGGGGRRGPAWVCC